jgi:hypothetical protein
MNGRWLVLGAIGVSWVALSVAACSGSSSNGESGGGSEAGADSTTQQDAAPAIDSPAEDSPVLTDAGTQPPAEAGDGSSPSQCTVFDASSLDEASVVAGFDQVWQVYRCYGCHQSSSQTVNDAGVGIVLSGNSAGLGDSGTIFPPNLTGDPATGLGCWTDQQITNAILDGVNSEGGTLCPPMPRFAQALTTADGGPKLGYPMDAGTAQEIVDYLRSLPVVVNQVHETTCASPAAGDGGADAAHDASAEQ